MIGVGVVPSFPAQGREDWPTADLLRSTPQSVATQPGVVKRAGETVLIACRDIAEEADPQAPQVDSLSGIEYEILLLAAQGMENKAIQANLNLLAKDVMWGSAAIHRKLGAPKGKANIFIPIPEERLRQLPTFKVTREGTRRPIRDAQKQLLELMAVESDANIMREMGIKRSSLVSNKLSLASLLGLSGTVELRRVAGALRNLRVYEGVIDKP
ncbi:MAG TPA: hypothetical protein VIJ68_02020, partial [Candidatus Saccharimonadales bacterium]